MNHNEKLIFKKNLTRLIELCDYIDTFEHFICGCDGAFDDGCPNCSYEQWKLEAQQELSKLDKIKASHKENNIQQPAPGTRYCKVHSTILLQGRQLCPICEHEEKYRFRDEFYAFRDGWNNVRFTLHNTTPNEIEAYQEGLELRKYYDENYPK